MNSEELVHHAEKGCLVIILVLLFALIMGIWMRLTDNVGKEWQQNPSGHTINIRKNTRHPQENNMLRYYPPVKQTVSRPRKETRCQTMEI